VRSSIHLYFEGEGGGLISLCVVYEEYNNVEKKLKQYFFFF